jgi:hypothetical protein
MGLVFADLVAVFLQAKLLKWLLSDIFGCFRLNLRIPRLWQARQLFVFFAIQAAG